jgi:hypothetical protein
MEGNNPVNALGKGVAQLYLLQFSALKGLLAPLGLIPRGSQQNRL